MNRSTELIGHWRDAQNKFDQFVLAILIAVCGYLAQSMEFARLGMNLQTIQTLALLLFGLSAFAGFRRIEMMTTSYLLNHQLEEAKENDEPDRIAKARNYLKIISDRARWWYGTRNIMM